ncbi:MAG: type II CAAX endopeptidase family protein [Cocleimonas sp.]
MTTLSHEEKQEPITNPWGFWATIGFSIIAFVVMSIIQGVVLVIYAINQGIDMDINNEDLAESINAIALDGDLLGLAEIPSAIIGVSLILLFASMRKPLSIKSYLHLHWPGIGTILKWLGIMFLAMIAMQVVMISLGVETPSFMTDVYGSTEHKWILWIAVVIGAPFFEEFLFRGFLFEGLRHSLSKITNTSIGTIITVILTAGIWAVIHMQYGWIEISSIFFVGIILAIARLKSGSLYVPIAMHMMMNLLASVAMEFQPELEALEKSAVGFISLPF